MATSKKEPRDQRLTVYLPEGAAAGRVLRILETGLVARMEETVPRDERFRFTLHLPGGVIAGEVSSVGQEDRLCRLQFAALTAGDRARLAPYLDEDD